MALLARNDSPGSVMATSSTPKPHPLGQGDQVHNPSLNLRDLPSLRAHSHEDATTTPADWDLIMHESPYTWIMLYPANGNSQQELFGTATHPRPHWTQQLQDASQSEKPPGIKDLNHVRDPRAEADYTPRHQ